MASPAPGVSRLLARDLSVFPPGSVEPVVKGIDLEVEPGGRVAITGPNGSGKSSLILGLAGLWAVQGHLELDGRPLLIRDAATWRRKVAVVMQDPSSQILHSTVFDEIAFAARNLGVPEQDIPSLVDDWAAALGLTEDLRRDPVTLSAGRQHLVVIASALAATPDLLLADEPTSHLDPQAASRVMEALENETRRGMSVVWVTQDPAEVGTPDHVIRLAGTGTTETSLTPTPGPGTMPAATDPESLVAEVQVTAMKENDSGPTIRVSRPFTLTIHSSGLTALVGPNGAGKSVLLGAIAGLVECPQVATRWSVQSQVTPIIALQYPEQQFFEERVADEVSYAATARGLTRADALDQAGSLFHRLGIDPTHMLGRRIWELSGGERRLVQLVATLAAPASAYLLDEPTAGLDPCRRRRLAIVLLETSQRTPILVATQDRDWAKSLSAQTLEVAGTRYQMGSKA